MLIFWWNKDQSMIRKVHHVSNFPLIVNRWADSAWDWEKGYEHKEWILALQYTNIYKAYTLSFTYFRHTQNEQRGIYVVYASELWQYSKWLSPDAILEDSKRAIPLSMCTYDWLVFLIINISFAHLAGCDCKVIEAQSVALKDLCTKDTEGKFEETTCTRSCRWGPIGVKESSWISCHRKFQ